MRSITSISVKNHAPKHLILASHCFAACKASQKFVVGVQSPSLSLRGGRLPLPALYNCPRYRSNVAERMRSYSSPPLIFRVCALGSLAVNSPPFYFFTRFNFLGTSFVTVRVLPPHSYKGTYLSLARNNNCLFVYFGEPAGHKPNLPHTDASR